MTATTSVLRLPLQLLGRSRVTVREGLVQNLVLAAEEGHAGLRAEHVDLSQAFMLTDVHRWRR